MRKIITVILTMTLVLVVGFLFLESNRKESSNLQIAKQESQKTRLITPLKNAENETIVDYYQLYSFEIDNQNWEEEETTTIQEIEIVPQELVVNDSIITFEEETEEVEEETYEEITIEETEELVYQVMEEKTNIELETYMSYSEEEETYIEESFSQEEEISYNEEENYEDTSYKEETYLDEDIYYEEKVYEDTSYEEETYLDDKEPIFDILTYEPEEEEIEVEVDDSGEWVYNYDTDEWEYIYYEEETYEEPTTENGEWVYNYDTDEWEYNYWVEDDNSDYEDYNDYEDDFSYEEDYYENDSSYEDYYEDDSSYYLGQEIVDYAMQWVGVTPYVLPENRWTENGYWNSLTEGTDCSGFTHLIYSAFGIYLPTGSDVYQYGVGTSISYEELMPGDIVVYRYGGHVAIYAGNDMIIHCSNPESGTIYSSIFYSSPTNYLRVIY